MYLEFMETLAKYIRALNETSNSIEEMVGLTPYLEFIPVFVDGDLCGFLADYTGGYFSYEDVTEAQREWWAARPKR